MSGLRDRIGIDFGRRLPAEEAMGFAGEHGVRWKASMPNVARVRSAAEAARVHLGLHSLSAVNVAEIALVTRDAVDAYLRA